MTTRKRTRPTSTGVLAGGPARTAEDERADVVAWLRDVNGCECIGCLRELTAANFIARGKHVGAAARVRKATETKGRR